MEKRTLEESVWDTLKEEMWPKLKKIVPPKYRLLVPLALLLLYGAGLYIKKAVHITLFQQSYLVSVQLLGVVEPGHEVSIYPPNLVDKLSNSYEAHYSNINVDDIKDRNLEVRIVNGFRSYTLLKTYIPKVPCIKIYYEIREKNE